MFIDKDEIEEMLGEYYDFEQVTDEQWNALDKAVVERWGETPYDDEEYDEYASVVDGCCSKLGFPQYD